MWSSYVNIIVKTTYRTQGTLKTFKRFYPFTVHTFLADSLVLSKLNYSIVVFGLLPKYFQNHLQHVQKSTAGYVIN